MPTKKSLPFEIMPNKETIRKLIQFCGGFYFRFHQTLAWQEQLYQADNTFKFNDILIAHLLSEWKTQFCWHKGAHSQVLPQSFKALESCFGNFLAKCVDFPIHPHKNKSVIDIDIVRLMSLKNRLYFATRNNGKKIHPKLVKLPRPLSHQTQFSYHWQQAQLHSFFAKLKRKYLAKISSIISPKDTLAFVEDNKVSHLFFSQLRMASIMVKGRANFEEMECG